MKPNQTVDTYNQLSEAFVEVNKDRSHLQAEISRFAALMPEGGKVIDLGCGVGFDSRDLHNLRPDLHITGIDISESMLKQFSKIAPGILTIKDDMLTMELVPSSLDGVWMNAALLHIPKEKAQKLLSKILVWIKPGGYLYIQTKEGQGEHLVTAEKYGRKDLKRFFAFYTKEELIKTLEASGFRVVDISTETRKEEQLIVLAQHLD